MTRRLASQTNIKLWDSSSQGLEYNPYCSLRLTRSSFTDSKYIDLVVRQNVYFIKTLAASDHYKAMSLDNTMLTLIPICIPTKSAWALLQGQAQRDVISFPLYILQKLYGQLDSEQQWIVSWGPLGGGRVYPGLISSTFPEQLMYVHQVWLNGISDHTFRSTCYKAIQRLNCRST